MIALLGGLGAAFAWGSGIVCSARSTRMIGAWSVVAWVMLVGLLANLALIAAGPSPGSFTFASLAWMLVAGAGNVGGLLLLYSALRSGKVGLVAPISSTEGAIAAVLAVVAGEALGATSALLLAVIVVGVVLAGVAPDGSARGQSGSLAFWLAVLSALSLGLGLFAAGHLSTLLPVVWAMLPARLVGVVVVTVPLAATRRLRISRSALPLVVAAGLAELLGFAFFEIGAYHSVAVATVLGSQCAAVASVAAYLLFGERLSRLQLAGVAAIVLGVAALTAVTLA